MPLAAGTSTAPVTVNGASSVVFAVQVTNRPDVGTGGASPAGFLFSAYVIYSDGTMDAIVSDGSWKTIGGAFGLSSSVDVWLIAK